MEIRNFTNYRVVYKKYKLMCNLLHVLKKIVRHYYIFKRAYVDSKRIFNNIEMTRNYADNQKYVQYT